MEIARTIINALEEKKGEDILLLDIQEISSFTDYFIICTGTSDRMLNGLGRAAIDAAKSSHKLNALLRGVPSSGWLVADFGDVVLHLFSPDQREFYQLEKLWDQGKVLLHLQ